MSFNTGLMSELPGTPAPVLQARQCAKCQNPGNAHQGVQMSPTRWICARCYRAPVIKAARQKR